MAWEQTGSVAEFASVAGDFLRTRPAEHTIILTAVERFNGGEGYGPDGGRYGWWRATGGGVTGAFIHTPPYPLVVSQLPPEAVPPLVETVVAAGGVNAERGVGAQLVRAGLAPRVHMESRLYRLGTLTPPDLPPPGTARVAGPADRDVAIAWYDAFLRELDDPGEDPAASVDDRLGYGGIVLWEVDGEPVALAGRTRTVAGMVRIGPVYTPPEHRRRGYAGAVTAELSRIARDLVEEVLLFTDLANPTSNSIYQRLGYRPVQDRVWLKV